jgi:hypothetical protein
MRKLLKFLWKIVSAPFRFVAWVVRSIIHTLNKGAHGIASYFTEEELDDTPLGDSLAATIENPRALLPHINALRQHLLRSVLAMVISTAISFLFVRNILDYLATPLAGGIHELVAIDVTENIGTVMRVTLLSCCTRSAGQISHKRSHGHPCGHFSLRWWHGICFFRHAPSSPTLPV